MIFGDNKRFWLLIAVLLLGGVFINWFERRGEASVERKPLKELSADLGKWKQKGSDKLFSEQVVSVLGTTDYIWRDYGAPDGRTADVYIGYYASQRTGATYHSPQNCMPGAGWEMKVPEMIEITSPSGKKLTANRYIIQNGQYQAIMIYWYQGRGRAVASEYTDKVYTVLDSVTRRRTDGSMVRIITTAGDDPGASLKEATDLAGHIADRISLFVPE